MSELLTIQLPDAFLETLVERAARLVQASASTQAPSSPYLTTDQAAAFLCCSRQRIHDLLSQGRLSRYKEGRRTLLLREELEQLVELDRTRRTR